MLEATGERMVPEQADIRTFWEHVHRYRFAADFVAGKRVLDVACGEGYGSKALLSAGARSVDGIDISEEACEHARRKYQINARCGSAEAIPLPDRSADVIVSFETIEHLNNPDVFLDECARVLDSRGVLIISTPNCRVYNAMLKAPNPFHCSDMTEEEFLRALRSRFPDVEVYSQALMSAAWWSPRSLAAEQSPWREIRGYWRLRACLLPRDMDDVDGRWRRSPVETILAKEGRLSRLVNPFALRRRSPRSDEVPTYIIAVARKG